MHIYIYIYIILWPRDLLPRRLNLVLLPQLRVVVCEPQVDTCVYCVFNGYFVCSVFVYASFILGVYCNVNLRWTLVDYCFVECICT